jgi:hypothetical protein
VIGLLAFGLLAAAQSSEATTEPAPTPAPAPAPALDRARTDPAPAPAGRLTLANPAPILGVDTETEVTFALDGPAAVAVEAPRCVASVGHFEEVVRLGPREFAARYVLPTGRFPQAAILAAEWAAPAAGALPGAGAATGASALRGFVIVPLRASASVSFRTDPGAQVTVTVGGRDFGPHLAGRDGLVEVPVVVPPGVGEARARSANAAGRASEQVVDLAPPDFPRLLLLVPLILPAGQPAEIVVFAMDRTGRPVDAAEVVLTTSNGRAFPLGGAPGAARFLVNAPGQRARGTLQIEARLRDDPGPIALASVPLGAGPAATLRLRPDRPRLPIGTGVPLRVFVSAEDAYGNPTSAEDLEIYVDGEPVPVRSFTDGRLAATIPAPERPDGRSHVGVEAVSRGLHAVVEVPLAVLGPRPDARRRAAPVMPDPRSTVTLAAGTILHLPASASFAVFARGERRPVSLPAWPRWLRAGLSLGFVRGTFTASDGGGSTRVTLQQVPLMLTARAERRILGSLTLAGSVGLGGDLGIVTLESAGYSVTRTRLGSLLGLGAEGAAWLRGGFAVLGLRILHADLASGRGSDGLMGTAGGLCLDLGYRIGW